MNLLQNVNMMMSNEVELNEQQAPILDTLTTREKRRKTPTQTCNTPAVTPSVVRGTSS